MALSAGVAIALQVVVNSVGLRDLGLGALICISGVTTARAGPAPRRARARPEATGRALLCALASGLLGAARRIHRGEHRTGRKPRGLAQTLSLVIASQLVFGLAIDRLGVSGTVAQGVGLLKVLGVALILAGGVLVVRA